MCVRKLNRFPGNGIEEVGSSEVECYLDTLTYLEAIGGADASDEGRSACIEMEKRFRPHRLGNFDGHFDRAGWVWLGNAERIMDVFSTDA